MITVHFDCNNVLEILVAVIVVVIIPFLIILTFLALSKSHLPRSPFFLYHLLPLMVSSSELHTPWNRLGKALSEDLLWVGL